MTTSRVAAVRGAMAPFLEFLARSPLVKPPAGGPVSDFVFGNPHELPLPGFVAALERWTPPQDEHWFAYKMSEPGPRRLVASALTERHGHPFAPEDVLLTNGAFAALAVSLGALLEPGDEVIFISPPWFFYEAHIVAYGGSPVRVAADPETWDLDTDAIRAAITERTRAIIVNSPNNPTGKVYSRASLDRLAGVLEEAGARHGRPIYLLSDEAYSRIMFDGRPYPSPTASYRFSLLLYTYGKTLLTPGQRLGYIALPEAMPGRGELREALFISQLVTGYAFPNALLQHALGDLEALSVDVGHLQRRRDLLVEELRAMGYRLHVPEGTFYLLVRSPLPDDQVFAARLAERRVLVLPGSVMDAPGTFRVSLTASDEMIERALPGFRAALQAAGAQSARA